MEKLSDTTEQDLIRALKEGSLKAFDEIYNLYSKRLYAYSLQFTKSVEEAEEIVQDVFVRLWKKKADIRQKETLHSLLFIMTKHHLINAYRSKINSPIYEDYIICIEKLSVEDTLHNIEYDEFLHILREEMKKMPATQQNVIRLSRFEQLSNKEIAERLSLSEQTVKNQLSMGLKSLKESISKSLAIFYLLFSCLIK